MKKSLPQRHLHPSLRQPCAPIRRTIIERPDAMTGLCQFALTKDRDRKDATARISDGNARIGDRFQSSIKAPFSLYPPERPAASPIMRPLSYARQF